MFSAGLASSRVIATDWNKLQQTEKLTWRGKKEEEEEKLWLQPPTFGNLVLDELDLVADYWFTIRMNIPLGLTNSELVVALIISTW